MNSSKRQLLYQVLNSSCSNKKPNKKPVVVSSAKTHETIDTASPLPCSLVEEPIEPTFDEDRKKYRRKNS